VKTKSLDALYKIKRTTPGKTQGGRDLRVKPVSSREGGGNLGLVGGKSAKRYQENGLASTSTGRDYNLRVWKWERDAVPFYGGEGELHPAQGGGKPTGVGGPQ